MKRRIFGMAACITALVLLAIACRQGEPTGDPKTPANSPIPEIDRTEEEPKAPPTPDLGDAG
ncbi:MAG: hypothetical protein KF894_25240 [Labilithrix sp.]|nr:hypothetical protein [Labilithrix sp.]